MHDSMTVAFRLFKGRVTIWHVDPEKDGSDDSCDWFGRCRNQELIKKIASRFEFEWSHGVPFGWFAENGEPNYSVHAIVIGMFHLATGEMFGYWSRKQARFLKDNTWRILHFAENNCDSLFASIANSYGEADEQITKRAWHFAAVIASWIERADRPWYRHPKWHLWHWRIQIDPVLNLKRWLFSRCCKCGKGFRYGESPVTNSWNSTGPKWLRSETDTYHSNCGGSEVVACSAKPDKLKEVQ